MISVALYAFVLAFLACVLATPRVRVWARQRGILDHPDKERKLHSRETPLGGGFAVFVGALIAVVSFASMVVAIAPEVDFDVRWLVPLLFASLLILAVGLIDDVLTLRARQKVLGQSLAILLLIAAGVRIDVLGVFGARYELGLLSIPFTLAWFLFAINSLNLLDGADGFATTIGLVICSTLCAMAAYQGDAAGVLVSAAMAGALSGFLIFNFPPSSIFLGESGSMLIGLVVGTLALQGNIKSATSFALATPVALLAIPLLDSFAAIVRRGLTGRAISSGDRAHIHHAMMRRGFGPRRLVLAAVMLSLIPAMGALLSIREHDERYAWLSLLSLVMILLGGRLFGFNELQLITSRSAAFFETLWIRNTRNSVRERRYGMLDSGHCDELWRKLVVFAERHDLTRIQFELRGSWMDDGRDVLWTHATPSAPPENFHSKMPLFANDRLFGTVEVAGTLQGNTGGQFMGPWGELVESLEPLVERLVEDAASQGVLMQEGLAKRVLFINRSYWPDCEATGQLLTELCEDLAQEFDVSVLAGQPNHVAEKGAAYQRSGVQRRNGVDVYRVQHSRFNKSTMFGKACNLVSFTMAACWQAFIIPRHQVVVVETDPFLLALLGGMLRRWRGSRLVIYMQDVYPDVAVAIGKVREGWVTRTLRYWLSRAYSAADGIVVLGEDMRNRLIDGGVSPEKIRCIPNWIDTKSIYPIKEDNQFRATHQLDDKFVVMHSGNMGLTQQLDQLIEVATRLKHRDDIVFMMVGDGASRSQLELMVQERELQNVRFLPYQPREDLAVSLSAADLHVVSMHPAITGCLVPSKMYGIMASGTPMLAIVPPASDLYTLVTDKQCGVAVSSGDLAAVETAVLDAADGKFDLAAMGAQSRQLVETTFDRNNSVEAFGCLLEDFMRRKETDPAHLVVPGAPTATTLDNFRERLSVGGDN